MESFPPPYEITQHDASHPFLMGKNTFDFVITIPKKILSINNNNDNKDSPQPEAVQNDVDNNNNSEQPQQEDQYEIQCIITQYNNNIHVMLTETGILSTHLSSHININSIHKKIDITTLQGGGIIPPQYTLLTRCLTTLFYQITQQQTILLSLSLNKTFNLNKKRNNGDDSDSESDDDGDEEFTSSKHKQYIKHIVNAVTQKMLSITAAAQPQYPSY